MGKKQATRIVAVVAAATLVIAACGSDSGADDAEGATEATSSTDDAGTVTV
jgi:ABC-type Fe3+-citrate transport system substrate-binding protein